MADGISVTLELVGPHRGQDYTFRNYHFVKGLLTLSGSGDQVGGAMRYLESTCQAYPVGSPQLKAALDRVEKERPADVHAQIQKSAAQTLLQKQDEISMKELQKAHSDLITQLEQARKTIQDLQAQNQELSGKNEGLTKEIQRLSQAAAESKQSEKPKDKADPAKK